MPQAETSEVRPPVQRLHLLLERMLLLAEMFHDWLVQQPNSSGYQLAKGMPSVLRNGRPFPLESLDMRIFSGHLAVSCLLLRPAERCC